MDVTWNFLSELPWPASWWTLVSSISYILAIASIPSVLIRRRGRPQSAISWILVMFTLPGVGLLFWWVFGRRHLARKKARRRESAQHRSRALLQLKDELPTNPKADWELSPIVRLPADDAQWVFPPTNGNRVRLLVDSKAAYPAIEQAIRRATDHLHIMFYIWNDDPTGRRFLEMLTEKANEGVEVRLACDALGSPRVAGRMLDPFRAAGGKFATFLRPKVFTRRPLLNFRNHRKIVISDGETGIVGGLNIGDEYTHDWHDAAVEIHGPAVDQLQEVFIDDWYFATGEALIDPRYFCRWQQTELTALLSDDGEIRFDDLNASCGVVASGPHTRDNIMGDSVFIAITRATKRIYITTPYFVPDQAIMAGLRTAVFRGVDVRVLLPGKNDSRLVQLASRSYYADLLASGVRIFEFQPCILHGKTMVIDDKFALIGSANIDNRSFKLNFETSCFIQSEAFNGRLSQEYQRDLQRSREVTLQDVEHQSYATKLVEAAAHLLSPLL